MNKVDNESNVYFMISIELSEIAKKIIELIRPEQTNYTSNITIEEVFDGGEIKKGGSPYHILLLSVLFLGFCYMSFGHECAAINSFVKSHTQDIETGEWKMNLNEDQQSKIQTYNNLKHQRQTITETLISSDFNQQLIKAKNIEVLTKDINSIQTEFDKEYKSNHLLLYISMSSTQECIEEASNLGINLPKNVDEAWKFFISYIPPNMFSKGTLAALIPIFTTFYTQVSEGSYNPYLTESTSKTFTTNLENAVNFIKFITTDAMDNIPYFKNLKDEQLLDIEIDTHIHTHGNTNVVEAISEGFVREMTIGTINRSLDIFTRGKSLKSIADSPLQIVPLTTILNTFVSVSRQLEPVKQLMVDKNIIEPAAELITNIDKVRTDFSDGKGITTVVDTVKLASSISNLRPNQIKKEEHFAELMQLFMDLKIPVSKDFKLACTTTILTPKVLIELLTKLNNINTNTEISKKNKNKAEKIRKTTLKIYKEESENNGINYENNRAFFNVFFGLLTGDYFEGSSDMSLTTIKSSISKSLSKLHIDKIAESGIKKLGIMTCDIVTGGLHGAVNTAIDMRRIVSKLVGKGKSFVRTANKMTDRIQKIINKDKEYLFTDQDINKILKVKNEDMVEPHIENVKKFVQFVTTKVSPIINHVKHIKKQIEDIGTSGGRRYFVSKRNRKNKSTKRRNKTKRRTRFY